MTGTRVVAVGGSDAGIAAALRARECDPAAVVTVVVADAYPNYSICGLPFYLSGETPDWRDLAHRTRDEIEAQGIRLLLDHRAEAVDVPDRCLLVRGPDDSVEVPYDALVIGTGAVPVRPALAGLDLPGVHVLHTMDDSFAVHGLVSGSARSAAIIGAGYIGTEMADALVHRGLEVTVIGRASTVLSTIDPEFGEEVGEELRRHGVDVVTGVTVERVDREGDRLVVTGSGGLRRVTDLVLVAAGVRPDTSLAATAGARSGAGGAVDVDWRMRTGVAGVLAAGDCVHTWHRLLRRHVYLPLGTTSHKQGRVAGENAVGGDREFAGSLGTQVVKVFGLAAARTGLRDDEARAAGYDPVTVETAADDHKRYYPGAVSLRLRITGDRRSGRLLGAQIVGPVQGQVAKRIDTCASALFHGMTVDEVSDLDLAHTPPLGSPWDAVQVATQGWSRTTAATGPR